MQGQDKGLLPYHGRPLAAWVLAALAPQVGHLTISANRHLPQYAALLQKAQPDQPAASAHVWPDAPDLPPHSGPMAGIITALRHLRTDWLMVAPCDTPHLPPDLVSRLLAQAMQTDADIVVPQTHTPAAPPRLHWVCALMHRRVAASAEQALVSGERKVGSWVRSRHWSSVSLTDDAAFTNMNTLETLHGRL